MLTPGEVGCYCEIFVCIIYVLTISDIPSLRACGSNVVDIVMSILYLHFSKLNVKQLSWDHLYKEFMSFCKVYKVFHLIYRLKK